jgi:hypothetical protein
MTDWYKKLIQKKEPKVKFIDFKFADIPENSTMLISSPQEIKAYIDSIPKGEKKSINDLRNELAKTHQADYTCPASGSIFIRIVAEAAIGDLRAGKKIDEITPFWRLINSNDKIWKKLSLTQQESEYFSNLA